MFGFAKRMTEAQDLKSSVYQNVKIIIDKGSVYPSAAEAAQAAQENETQK